MNRLAAVARSLRRFVPFTGAASAAIIAALILLGTLETAELDVYSRLFELRGPRPPAAPIVIVTIDEDSFDELNLAWPFPRAVHGRLVEIIAAAEPLAIGFDVLFPEPSAHGPEDDAALGQAVARAGRVVLGAGITEVAEAFYTKVDLNPPIPVIREGAAAVAPVNYTIDADGQLRRAVVRPLLGDERLEGWDLALYRLAAAGGVPIAPAPADSAILVNFRGGPSTFPWVPYHRVLNGEVPPETFRGAIVMIGATTPILQDIFSTPFARARQMPGVEVHANVLDTLIRGDQVRAISPHLVLVVAVAAALVGAWLAARLPVLRALAVTAGLWTGLAAGVVLAFSLADVWVPGVGVTIGLVLGYGSTVIENFVREQREKRRLSQFFSPSVLTEIVRHKRDEALGSRRRVVTVLFSDIRGFTSISERVEPEVVVDMLREYLTEMTEVVFRHGGTVDKYIGDCIMALYNVPFEDADHAVNAVRTALDLQERTLAVAARWQARLGVAIRNGVGINTGDAVVGTMGSRQRLEYTAIGDTVNLASRLESLTKDYGTGVIISESTQARVKDHFLTRELGAVAVKGKTRPVKIYAVLPADMRRHPRLAIDAAATVVALGTATEVAARVADVSEGGLSLVGLPEGWAAGTPVQVRCEGGALAKPLIAEATIVWRRGDRAGLSFVQAAAPIGLPASGPYVRTSP
jgi:adenylate cyclase